MLHLSIVYTPLQYVCALGNEKMVRYLLEKGADPTIKDKTGRDALEIAQHLNRSGVVKFLQNRKNSSAGDQNLLANLSNKLEIHKIMFENQIQQITRVLNDKMNQVENDYL
jgi:ankyrin repeat protein